MKYLKTHEGFFDFFKKKEIKKTTFTKEEVDKFKSELRQSHYPGIIIYFEKTDHRMQKKLDKKYPEAPVEKIIISFKGGDILYSVIESEIRVMRTNEGYEIFTTSNFDSDSNRNVISIDDAIRDINSYLLFLTVAFVLLPVSSPLRRFTRTSKNTTTIKTLTAQEAISLVRDYSIIVNGKVSRFRLRELLEEIGLESFHGEKLNTKEELVKNLRDKEYSLGYHKIDVVD